VPLPSFVLGGDSGQTQENSLSLSGSTQYLLNLGSYLQSLGDTPVIPVSSQSMTVEELSRGLVSVADTASSLEHPLQRQLLQMVAVSFSCTC